MVKRDPKTGQEIRNEWQRETDIMYYLSSTNVAKIKEEFDAKGTKRRGWLAGWLAGCKNGHC